MKKSLTILGIETSCDETAASILKFKNRQLKILSNIISSQVKIHAKYGGVYPMLAKREHQKNLPVVIKKALEKAKKPKIDLIAITIGPGLEPCLWAGINFTKDLAKKIKKPIIPVNHIEAHILINFTGDNFRFPISNFQSLFPAIALVASGGHTELILMNGIGKYKILGETRDDAAGECFDKTARILGLGYPGGPLISQLADEQKTKKQKTGPEIKLPRPMIHSSDYDFSFSGLKTAVLYQYKKSKTKNQEFIKRMAKEIQQAIIDVLIKKTLKAVRDYNAKTIILGGGVAANKELRSQLEWQIKNNKLKIDFLIPPINLCTDNAVMIAIAGFFNQHKKTRKYEKIKVKANLKIEEKT